MGIFPESLPIPLFPIRLTPARKLYDTNCLFAISTYIDYNTFFRSMLSVTVGPTKGNFSSLPSARAYQIHVPNFWPGKRCIYSTHCFTVFMYNTSSCARFARTTTCVC